MSLFILDSDHLILLQYGHEQLQYYVYHTPKEQVAITVINMEELLRGRFAQIRRAQKPAKLIEAYHYLHKTFIFIARFQILEYTVSANQIFTGLRQ